MQYAAPDDKGILELLFRLGNSNGYNSIFSAFANGFTVPYSVLYLIIAYARGEIEKRKKSSAEHARNQGSGA